MASRVETEIPQNIDVLHKTALSPEQLIDRFLLPPGKVSHLRGRGIVLGHSHGVLDFHQMAGRLIRHLATRGLAQVYLEVEENYQKDVGSYLETGKFSRRLTSYLDHRKDRFDGYEDLYFTFRAARESGVHLRCLDQPDRPTLFGTRRDPKGLRGHNRDEHMFLKFLEYRQEDSGDFIVICGNNHAALWSFVPYDANSRSEDDPIVSLGLRLRTKYGQDVSSIMTLGNPRMEIYRRLSALRFDGQVAWSFADIAGSRLAETGKYNYRKLRDICQGIVFLPNSTVSR